MADPKGSLVIRGGTLVDGSGADPRRDVIIVVEGGRIKALEERKPGPQIEREGVKFIDAAGKTILPGLWDVHVHLLDWMGELYLAHGVTSIL